MRKLDEDRRFYEQEILGLYNYLFSYINTITGDRLLSADIVQDTMEIAWQKLDLIRNYTNFKKTLAAIAKNKLMNYYRKHKAEMNSIPFSDETLLCQSGENFISALLEREERRQLLMLIGQLREDYVRIILMHYYYGLPLCQVADILNKNYNTVVCWHRRALKRLGMLLAKQKNTCWGPALIGGYRCNHKVYMVRKPDCKKIIK